MDTPDILIHVHPELSAEGRAKVENEVMERAGVLSACFSQSSNPHALTVVYNPEAISGKQILEAVRKFDPAASMVGM